MTLDLKKIDWKIVILVIWAIVSFLYIAWNSYEGFKLNVMQNAYTAGQTDTVNRLINQASSKECKPFNVYSWEKKVDLINVACLQQAAPQEEETPKEGKK